MSMPEPPELVALAKARENLSAARELFDRYPGIATSQGILCDVLRGDCAVVGAWAQL
jgi:hypothetical protein